jgi:hypothetical protein
LRESYARYQKESRKEMSRILTEFCTVARQAGCGRQSEEHGQEVVDTRGEEAALCGVSNEVRYELTTNDSLLTGGVQIRPVRRAAAAT